MRRLYLETTYRIMRSDHRENASGENAYAESQISCVHAQISLSHAYQDHQWVTEVSYLVESATSYWFTVRRPFGAAAAGVGLVRFFGRKRVGRSHVE